MMQFMAEQFERINKKLNTIIDLQVKTLEAIAKLSADQQKFREEVLTQLDRIEGAVLRSDQILQAILVNDWTGCDSLIIGGTPLNGQYEIQSKQMLIGILKSQNVGVFAGKCYQQLLEFLTSKVAKAEWSGTVIAARSLPAGKIVGDPVVQKSWRAYQSQRIDAYVAASEFVNGKLGKVAATKPAGPLARFLQPVADAKSQAKLAAIMARRDVQDNFDSFTCGTSSDLSPGIRYLICVGTGEKDVPPLESKWGGLLGSDLIGPYVFGVIDTGITMSSLVDFAEKTGEPFAFVSVGDVEKFEKDGPSPAMTAALAKGSGRTLLTRLQWLTDANLLQQGIAYGDYTAQLVEETLYDPITRSLKIDPDLNSVERSAMIKKAVDAMQKNPVLARNVVLLAMRHAISDEEGGPDKADAVKYRETYYSLGLGDFVLPRACGTEPSVREKLREMFPNWVFEYRATEAEKAGNPALSECPPEQRGNLEVENPRT